MLHLDSLLDFTNSSCTRHQRVPGSPGDIHIKIKYGTILVTTVTLFSDLFRLNALWVSDSVTICYHPKDCHIIYVANDTSHRPPCESWRPQLMSAPWTEPIIIIVWEMRKSVMCSSHKSHNTKHQMKTNWEKWNGFLKPDKDTLQQNRHADRHASCCPSKHWHEYVFTLNNNIEREPQFQIVHFVRFLHGAFVSSLLTGAFKIKRIKCKTKKLFKNKFPQIQICVFHPRDCRNALRVFTV